MKKKLLVVILSMVFSICVLYTAFGAWEDRTETEIYIEAADSFPKNIKPEKKGRDITITQQIGDQESYQFDSSWKFINQ